MQITVKGVTLGYATVGEGPDFLILHGWGRSSQDWVSVAHTLSSYFRVWLLDLPGFGQSGMPPALWGVQDYCDLVDKFIKDQDIQKLTLLGHSFGGMVAIGIAKNRPEYLVKLILVASTGIRLQRTIEAQIMLLISKLGRLVVSVLPGRLGEKVESRFLGALARRGLEYALFPALRPIFKRVVDQNWEPYLKDIEVPTLIVAGENDHAVSVVYAKRMNQQIPGSTLKILPGAGHFPFFDKEADFLRILKIFLGAEPR